MNGDSTAAYCTGPGPHAICHGGKYVLTTVWGRFSHSRLLRWPFFCSSILALKIVAVIKGPVAIFTIPVAEEKKGRSKISYLQIVSGLLNAPWILLGWKNCSIKTIIVWSRSGHNSESVYKWIQNWKVFIAMKRLFAVQCRFVGELGSILSTDSVSYTHLTLPTKA